jgi:hypothetical protein
VPYWVFQGVPYKGAIQLDDREGRKGDEAYIYFKKVTKNKVFTLNFTILSLIQVLHDENNGFWLDDWIYWHLVKNIINYNRSQSMTHSILYQTTSVFSSTVTDLVLINE